MTKKVTLASLAQQMAKGFAALNARMTKLDDRMERNFAAVADDITDIKRDMATKDQIIALHAQVNSIEDQLRGMKHGKLEARVAEIEEEIFGESRA